MRIFLFITHRIFVMLKLFSFKYYYYIICYMILEMNSPLYERTKKVLRRNIIYYTFKINRICRRIEIYR